MTTTQRPPRGGVSSPAYDGTTQSGKMLADLKSVMQLLIVNQKGAIENEGLNKISVETSFDARRLMDVCAVLNAINTDVHNAARMDTHQLNFITELGNRNAIRATTDDATLFASRLRQLNAVLQGPSAHVFLHRAMDAALPKQATAEVGT